MSTKADILNDDQLDHLEDRVYFDCVDNSFNIEIHPDSPACVCIQEPNEYDEVGFFSIKEGSKMFKNLAKYFKERKV